MVTDSNATNQADAVSVDLHFIISNNYQNILK